MIMVDWLLEVMIFSC